MQRIVWLGFLKPVKALRRERSGNPDLCLCDYFDPIGRTSSGSIIMTGLALGRQVSGLIRSRRRTTAPALAFPVIQLVY